MDQAVKIESLEELPLQNRIVSELPADPVQSNHTRQVTGACYSRVNPRQVSEPELVAYSREMMENLDLHESVAKTQRFVEVFSGHRLLDEMQPYAWCYGGHQFGNWAGQLGDGRAINLAEVVNQRNQRWVLQLKGAGDTPYSRMADGLAVLRSSVREFLCSEAMHHLGVPTTRALSLMVTGDMVMRDMFYDGRAKEEPGAVVCRVSPSFIRFGNFELFASRGDVDNLRTLVDFTIRTDFSHLGDPQQNADAKQIYIEWFKEICRSTAKLMVHWMRVGFVHGVMNTDNMSIMGLTIDYGPYGWLEDYDPEWTPNTTDASGRRYCFGRQPGISLWNLNRLANAIHPLIEDKEALEEALGDYAELFNQGWKEMMAAKLGLLAFEESSDQKLVDDLMEVLTCVETDMTLFFRGLPDVPFSQGTLSAEELPKELLIAYYQLDQLDEEKLAAITAWLASYQQRLVKDARSNGERRQAMNQVNPKYVLRNYLAQLAIDDAEKGDYAKVNELLEVLRKPYDDQPEFEQYAAKRPEWARSRAGCSMLSCSS
ncbi:MAG: hypothetical protein ACI8P9_002448 [Parasphingorhabdus sp.]